MDVNLKWLVGDKNDNDWTLAIYILGGILSSIVVCVVAFFITRKCGCQDRTAADRRRRDRNRNREGNDEENPENIRMIEHRRYVHAQQDPNMWARPVVVAVGDAVGAAVA
ncbi:hypothetical protein GCK72_012810 [Caenorhabditis remanei]|uniref:Transmembrane protein n=1 Tax=Caenorhabditis remanei TaxID=31234 RepID=A0A6A5GM48_CAERE|nr:hypothetical protein GCK72_012810 [Caenorhabditis remanei]KAF1756357.1 hypothetical protein GCK72_012810 [Caenorhabditis remanei]